MMSEKTDTRPMVAIDGLKIKEIREEKGLTQLYIATVIGVTTDTVSRWENRKYPSIKRENCQKLAQALGVSLEEILEKKEVDQVAVEKDSRQENYWLRKFFPRWILVTSLFLIAGGIAFIFWWFQEKNEPVQASALRILPAHAPAGSVFPVLIKIEMDNRGIHSLIVKERLPEGCQAVGGSPAFNMTDNGKPLLKWVNRINRISYIAYLVQTPEDFSSNKLEGFKGEIILGSTAKPKEIYGDNSINLSPYHWVDNDGNNMIDDEEILVFYDLFSEIKKLDINSELIDEIWASKGYEWDSREGQYRILP